jgi:glycosyltransferase involved in cell wall biosynthesis
LKILHTVQRYAPDTGGSEEVVKQLSEYLDSFGHEVTVATSKSSRRSFTELNGVKIVEFDCGGNIVDGIRGDFESYRRFVQNGNYNVMMNYAAQIWSTDLVYDLLPALATKKVMVPCGYSQLSNPRYAEYFRQLPRILRAYDAVVYLSDNYIDKSFGDHHGLVNGIVIPNAADRREFFGRQVGMFRKRYNLDGKTIILNVSNHSRLKNHNFFWKAISLLNDPAVTPVLIANAYHPSPKKWLTECYATCRIRGWLPGTLLLENLPRDEVVQAYCDADAFVFGSIVECSPLVMFEAFASRTLFVTTNCGNVRDYEDVVCLVETEKEAVDIVREFMAHPQRFAGRIEKGYRKFLDRLNWKTIAREYERLYQKLLQDQVI